MFLPVDFVVSDADKPTVRVAWSTAATSHRLAGQQYYTVLSKWLLPYLASPAEGPEPADAALLPVVHLPAGAHVLCDEPEPAVNIDQVLHVGLFVFIVVLWWLVRALHNTPQR